VADPAWKGTIVSAFGGGTVSFVIDPVSGLITKATWGGPIAGHPAPGYASLSGILNCDVDFKPGGLPSHPGDAWAAAETGLLRLVPGKTYTMTITED
jgi:hypothetical protein